MKGAVSRRLTEDCVSRSETYEVNKDLQNCVCSAYFGFAKMQSSVIRFADATSFHWIAVSGSAAYGYRVPLAGKRRLYACGRDERA